MDLSTYVLVGRFDLPEPTRTAAPPGSVLAQEVSAITFNWDTGTLFVVGDGGTSVVEISTTGELISSMTLAAGSSPQGTEFYDPEGLTYIGGGRFVMTEERDRNLVLFTYEADGTLTRSEAQTVDLGTFVQNIGLEGLTYDPLTEGFIIVKETGPEGIFQTTVDFDAGTASNGSSTTENSIDLFDPSLLGLLDFADVYALSSNAFFDGQPDEGHLLVLSQESGVIVEVDRDGHVISSLTIVSNPGNPLSVPAQQHEGLTVDANGYLYVVSENGGGDFDHPQVWVYAPSSTPNSAPTAITLTDPVATLDETDSTAVRIKVAGIDVTDDGLGTNVLSVSGADAAIFEVDSTGLYIRAGTVLDFETQSSFSVTVSVDDAGVGGSPDASTTYTLTLNDVLLENGPPVVYISEVAAWSSGNSPVGADWFEVTNGGSSALDITGWKVDDSSNSFGSALALNGITSIAPGESVIFLEGNAATVTAFINTWFGGVKPAGLQIGTYSGGGIGLSTGGDALNLFNGDGELQASVSFGASPAGPTFATFDNAAGLDGTAIVDLSKVGLHGSFVPPGDANEIGSPGTVGGLIISEVAPWASGNSTVGAEWFELTNTSAFAIDVTGWRMDDSSGSFAASVGLNGVTTIAPGESVIFIETADPAKVAAFISTWFGDNPPAGLQIGTYSGGGVGLGTGGDGVNVYDSAGLLHASVTFGTSPSGPTFATFDNAAGVNGAVTGLSAVGVHAGFTAIGNPVEIGSPGEIAVVNDAPTANDDTVSAVGENSAALQFAFAALLANDKAGPATETTQTLTITSVGGAVGGTVTIDGTNVVFTPTAGFSGTASFTYTARDNGQSYGVNDFRTDTATVSFLVNAAPDFTSPATFTAPENQAVVGTVVTSDAEGDAVTLTLSGGADAGLFSFDAGTGQLSFAVSPDFEAPADADHDNVYEIEITAEDSFGNLTTQTVSVSVTDVGETGTTITGTGRDDVLDGTSGSDVIRGGNGNDVIDAGGGDDTVSGGNDDDQMFGGDGNDTLDGGNGDDLIDAREGDDTIRGGNGDDVIDAGNGNNTATGGNGDDRYSGGLGVDAFTGGNGNDVIDTGGGNDTINGGNDDDTIDAGDGDDTVLGGNGNDGLTAGAGDDTVSGGNGDDVIDGGDGDDDATGGNGDDLLSGGLGADVLDGGAGDDQLDGGAGIDQLRGRQGADTFVFASGDSALGTPDQILDFASRDGDVVDLSAFGIETTDIVLTRTATRDYLVTIDLDDNGSADFALAIHSVGAFSISDILV